MLDDECSAYDQDRERDRTGGDSSGFFYFYVRERSEPALFGADGTQFTVLKRRICVLQNLLLVGDYKLGYVVAAHAVDRSGCARSNRIGIATRMLGGHGYGPVGTAGDSALVVKGIGVAEIKDEAGVL